MIRVWGALLLLVGNPVAAQDGPIAKLGLVTAQAAAVATKITLPSEAALIASPPPSSINYVRVLSYYGDGLDTNSGATWIRSLTQSSGNGRRQASDGSWWQIAETRIDPTQLGARNSDRTTDSTAAILEAIAISANGRYPSESRAGSRGVLLSAPRTAAAYPAFSGAYGVTSEVLMQAGVALTIEAGAELLALPTFAGSAVIASTDTCVWQCIAAKIQIDGTLNANSIANYGIWERSGSGWGIAAPGQITGATLAGLEMGSASSSYTAYDNIVGPLRVYAPASYTFPATNNASGAGVQLTNKATDNNFHDLILTGYRTGYQDFGTNNKLLEAHAYTAGNGNGHPNFGPMTAGFDLEGSDAELADIYTDTPTNMQDSSITVVSGIVFGTAARNYHIRGAKVFLNYDNFADTTKYANNVVNGVVNNAGNFSNSISDLTLDTANSSLIKYANGFGNGESSLPRDNVSITGGSPGTRYAASERRSTSRAVSADVRHNWLANSAFSIWQRGDGDFDASVANARVFGPDRWFSVADGSGGARTLRRYKITAAEAFTYYSLQASNALEVQRAGAGSETYWRLEQVLPRDYLIAMAGKRMTLSFAIEIVSGTYPSASSKFGVEQNFGSGGSASVFTETTFATTASDISSSFSRKSFTVNIPDINSKTIGAGAYIGFYFTFPITGSFDLRLTEPFLTDGTEQAIYDLPDPQIELRKARDYYEQITATTVNGGEFIQAQPKVNIPTVTASNGTLGSPTINGVLLTDTTSRSSTLTFTSAEP